MPMIGHRHMCLYQSNYKTLIVLAISTCAYMWGNKGIGKYHKTGEISNF